MADDKSVEQQSAYQERLKFSWTAASVALIIHTTLIVLFARYLHGSFRYGSEGLDAWKLWFLLDLPFSLWTLITDGLINLMFPKRSAELWNVLEAIQFGILGGIQYALFFGWFFSRRRKVPASFNGNAS